MTFHKGNMWKDSNARLKLFTGNASINQRGELIMGRGAAEEAKQLYPGCAIWFGAAVQNHKKAFPGVPYYLLTHPGYPVGVLQVKFHHDDLADLDLIRESCEVLRRHAATHDSGIAVNFPGIGAGGLKRHVVLPLLEPLENSPNVEVWEYPWS